MQNVQPIVRIFTANSYSFHVNLKDISHEESLRELIPGVNSINWLAGHIIKYKYDVLETLGDEKPAEAFERYDRQRGYKPGEDAAQIDDLRTLSRALSDRIVETLESREWKDSEEDIETLKRIAFWGFHEGYHVGQIAILRRALGKDGAIK